MLACFNQLYKIDEAVFRVWMEALKGDSSVVLWLLKFPPVAVDNILKGARKYKLKRNQIVFGNTLPKKAYLERATHADLVLDTPLVNAHTSATDVLWAGVPMITTARDSMISRVASSLCLAGHLPQMVVPNLAEYAQLLARLPAKPHRLAQMQAATRIARSTSPLFDTNRWVRNLDVALTLGWESRAAQRKLQRDAQGRKGSRDKGEGAASAGEDGFHVIVHARQE